MPLLSMAWRAVDPAGELIAVINGEAHTQFFESLSAQTHVLIVHPGALRITPQAYVETAQTGLRVPPGLDLRLRPAEQRLIARAGNDLVHCLRLADATLKPLEPDPGPIYLAPGDAYVALISGQPPLTPDARLATARFIHLRDYFNADTLAVELLRHLRAHPDSEGPASAALGAVVVECR